MLAGPVCREEEFVSEKEENGDGGRMRAGGSVLRSQ